MNDTERRLEANDAILGSDFAGLYREAMAKTEPAGPSGVWIVAGTSWHYEGPGWVIPYATEIEAMRAMNKGDGERVYFVPHGVDLRDVMNAWPKAVGE